MLKTVYPPKTLFAGGITRLQNMKESNPINVAHTKHIGKVLFTGVGMCPVDN